METKSLDYLTNQSIYIDIQDCIVYIGMSFAINYFDSQRQRDYQRHLTHLRNKNKLKAKQLNTTRQKQVPRSMLLHTTVQQLSSCETLQERPTEKKTLVKVEDLPILVRRMVAKKNVRHFIRNLKRAHYNKIETKGNSFDSNLFQERLNKNIVNAQEFSFFKLKGLVISDIYNVIIYLITVFSYIYINLLATFQCSLQEFRLSQSNQIWVKASWVICLLIAILKIICSCVLQINVNGIKLIYIVDISKKYFNCAHSYIDILLVISIVMILKLNNNVQSAVITYFVSLIHIAISQRIDQAIVRHLLVNNTIKQYFSLVRLLLANFFLAHLFGSIFLSVAALQHGFNWLIKYGIQSTFWFDQYAFSVYWATTIITTVGFGDVTISNNIQAIIVTVVMLIGCLILSYNISQVATIFHNLMDKKDELQSQLYCLKILKSVSKIDEQLQKKIADYLINSFEVKYQFREQEIKELLQKLPQTLKQQFMYHSGIVFFSKMPFFHLLKSETKKLLIEKINMNILSPNQYLTHNSYYRHGFRKIYALRYGELSLCYKKRGSTLNGVIVDSVTVDVSDHSVLLNSFLLNRKSKLNYSIMCRTFCSIASLQFDQLRECLESVSLDFQLWRHIYDSDRSLNQEWAFKPCEQCNQLHSKFNCPKLVYMPLRSIVFLKNCYHKDHFQSSRNSHRSQSYYSSMKIYLAQTRLKKKFPKKSALKYFKRIFAPLQKSHYHIIDKQAKSMKIQRQKLNSLQYQGDQMSNRQRKSKKHKKMIKQLNQFNFNEKLLDQMHFQLDSPCDFDNYFEKHNPKNLVKIDLTEYEIPINMFRMASA